MHTSAVPYKILLKESAMRADGSCFTDHEVHAALKRKGFKQLNAGVDRNEWFNCSVSAAKAAIIAVRNGFANIENRTQAFKMRPEQTIAVQRTIQYFQQAKRDEPDRAPKFLWNAKMRFGKTFASYELARKISALLSRRKR